MAIPSPRSEGGQTTARHQKPWTGNASEDKARYFQDCKSMCKGYDVISTGLWMAAENPELACSPDGLVMDPSLSDHQLGKYGLLEVKCPLMLEEKDVKDFDKVLPKKQISQFRLERRDGSMKLKTKHR